jgi:hypothetical protein
VTADQAPWGWRLQRAWALGEARWWALAGGLVLCAVVLVATVVSHQRAQDRLADLDTQLARARAAAQPITTPQTAALDKDFVQALGPTLNAAQVVQELQRACSTSGVQLASVQAQERAASADQLGRLELLVTLRGAYTGTKLVLKQVVERFPSITVQRLRMRRAQSPTDIETSVTLSAWSKPLAAASSPAASGGR